MSLTDEHKLVATEIDEDNEIDDNQLAMVADEVEFIRIGFKRIANIVKKTNDRLDVISADVSSVKRTLERIERRL